MPVILPVETELSFVPIWLSTHQVRAAVRISLGMMIPASWHARRPSAAYWEFELSPPAMPSRVFLTGILRTTFGFSFAPGGVNSRVPLLGAPPVAVGGGAPAGVSIART